MGLAKKYNYREVEEKLSAYWQRLGIYRFDADSGKEVYSIDTPPPTVSGNLHMGHVYSYSHADFMARFQRMSGKEVFYPMGFDDNGLPTELLVERQLQQRAEDMGVEEFRRRCMEMGASAADAYRSLWQALGLSVDWRHSYRTIGRKAQRVAQWSFIDLYRKGRIYRQQAPVIWCPRCQTAIAQAELEDVQRPSVFYQLEFGSKGEQSLAIATTRPELLPACVAIFVHPQDTRYASIVGREITVPLSGRKVPILADAAADPDLGTGAVMCCTFGDATDVHWWRQHDLPLYKIVGRDGRMTEQAGDYMGLRAAQARERIVADLRGRGLVQDTQSTQQVVRVHERCAAPVEYVVAPQWFVRILDAKEELRQAGAAIKWHPPHMQTKYQQWLDNLKWDWCISRQRPFGVPFPVWHCDGCAAVRLAAEDELPVDPRGLGLDEYCTCGGTWCGDSDVMDTWATSSLTPQLAYGAAGTAMSVRPLAHEIIRTWAFYSVVKAHYHWGRPPWGALMVSGWGLAEQGQGKISKSKGSTALKPDEALATYPADALRYWAASTALGKDAYISEGKMRAGAKWQAKLWNAARFAERFLADYRPPAIVPELSLADAWILDRMQRLITDATRRLAGYDYAAAKSLIEVFFWRDFVDYYLEMAKKRLYAAEGAGAPYALYAVLLGVIKMLAPYMPFVTEEIYLALFAASDGYESVHRAAWPTPLAELANAQAGHAGETLCAVARAVRGYKSEAGLSLGCELARLEVVAGVSLRGGEEDLASITRAREVIYVQGLSADIEQIIGCDGLLFGIRRETG